MLTNGYISMSYREEERKKAILQNVSDKIEEAVRVDGGYIAAICFPDTFSSHKKIIELLP